MYYLLLHRLCRKSRMFIPLKQNSLNQTIMLLWIYLYVSDQLFGPLYGDFRPTINEDGHPRHCPSPCLCVGRWFGMPLPERILCNCLSWWHAHWLVVYAAGYILNNQNPMLIAMCGCDDDNMGYFKGRMSEVGDWTLLWTWKIACLITTVFSLRRWCCGRGMRIWLLQCNSVCPFIGELFIHFQDMLSMEKTKQVLA